MQLFDYSTKFIVCGVTNCIIHVLFISCKKQRSGYSSARSTRMASIVIIIQRAAAVRTGGHDRNKCIVLLKLINVIAFNQHETEQALKDRCFFFHQQHLIGLVQKLLINLLYIKQALRENLLLICSSESFCCAQGLKTFSALKKQARVKEV